MRTATEVIDRIDQRAREAGRLFGVRAHRTSDHPRGEGTAWMTCAGCPEIFFSYSEALAKSRRLNSSCTRGIFYVAEAL